MRNRLWMVVASAFVPMVGLYFLLPDPATHDVYYTILGGLAVAAMVTGIWVHRPRPLLPFVLLVAGMGLMLAGDTVWAVYETALQVEAPYPSVADAVFLLAYPVLFAGTAMLVRGARDRRGIALEAWIIASGSAALVWQFLMGPALADSSSTLLARLVSAGYPAVDLLLVAVIARLLLLGVWRSPCLLLICAGFVTALAADSLYGVQALAGEYSTGVWYDAGWLLEYVLLAVALVHPSVRDVSSVVRTNVPVRVRSRLVALAIAGMIAPTVLAVQAFTHSSTDLLAFAVIWSVLFLLVVVRLRGLMLVLDKLLRKMRYHAYHDGLTGLENRLCFTERIEKALTDRRASFAVCYLDLDGFKHVNDTAGHLAGDALLVAVAKRLRAGIRTQDAAARIGGDEFAVYSPGVSTDEQARSIADRLQTAMDQPFLVEDEESPLGVSIGVTTARSGDTFDEIISRADAAMYRVKKRHQRSLPFRAATG